MMNARSATILPFKRPRRNVKPYREYGRRCKTCRGPLFTSEVGTGQTPEGYRVTLTEVFCLKGCEHTFTPTERELALWSLTAEVSDVLSSNL
jgi:hypothetical protein